MYVTARADPKGVIGTDAMYVLYPLPTEARSKVLSRFRGAESGQHSILRYNCFVSIADAD